MLCSFMNYINSFMAQLRMIKIRKYNNTFEYLEVKNKSSSAKIALQGAHIFDYSNKSTQLLWLSEESSFIQGEAIRGGIPLCWPSFGMNNPSLSQHGFARTSLFTLISVNEENDTSSEILLRLSHSKQSLALWDYKFELTLKITISDTLSLELQTINLDTKVFKVTQAFHTYFNISNIDDVKISGLDKKPYLNALTNRMQNQVGDIKFKAEVDCVYQDVHECLILEDKKTQVKICNEGSSSVIIWNPWIEKCARMSAMNKDAYKKFVCVESANAYKDFKTLKPNESHTLKTTFTTL